MFNFNTAIHMPTHRPMANTKIMQKTFSFARRMQSAAQVLHHSGEENTNGANPHICFSENIRFRVVMKNRTFCVKLKISAHPVLHISKY